MGLELFVLFAPRARCQVSVFKEGGGIEGELGCGLSPSEIWL